MLADVAFETRDGFTVASVTGEIDMSNSGELTASLEQAVGKDACGLVLDLTRTTYLDSAGLHFLFELGKALRDRGQRLQVVVPEDSTLEPVITLVKVDALAPISRSLEHAIAELEEFRKANDPGQSPGSLDASSG